MLRKAKGRFRVFTRVWWRKAQPSDGRWPNNLVPSAGLKRTIGRYETESEAVDACRFYNATHKPGRYSRKAEYERE